MTKDIIIIGAGPGGYETAIRACQLGLNVTLIEKAEVGGTCLNRGCIPTKTLWKIADLYKEIRESETFGIEVNDHKLLADKIKQRKTEIIERLRSGVEYLFKTYDNLTFIRGEASFKDNKTVVVKTLEGETKELTADKIIIATGSKDYKPTNIEGIDHPRVLTSTGLLELEEIPKSMVVIGTGVIGMEFASIYSQFGTEVTVVGNKLLKTEDGEIQKRLKSILKSDTLKFVTGVYAKKIVEEDGRLKIISQKVGKDKFEETYADYVLVASGRSSNTDNLGLENTDIKTENNAIVVDENLQTNVEGIYAIGDCVYKNTQLAHVASNQGKNLVREFSGKDRNINMDIVPAVVFTVPEIASVGLTEEKAKEQNIDYVTSKFMYQANGKALSLNATEGFVKIVATKDLSKILGCHIIGHDASTIIHFAAIAMNNNVGVEGLSAMIYAHPTISEVFMDSVEQLEGLSINTPNPNK
ncbi:dihydrolipoyl dehydrogenase [Finegoldia magna]|uniref:dihydrolipoyl dehydrogenase n=1 Tax=Finegoldia magna TaxID=1260 RepID=UPI0012AF36D5|nr:dihydrolipoyl dehydrogenase [Finegoldia magna]MSB16743.1 dihydrolipoyl dehydrogenase [Finegoldia magna]MSD45549.1 dihydrolipoyl dehydrogenase [Finegoldia magna]